MAKSSVMPGRFTAQIEGPFVVLRLGMRVNRLFLFWQWIPTLIALLPLLRQPHHYNASGFLGGFSIYYWPMGIVMTQYWRSLDELEAFARQKDNTYLELWRRYDASPAASGCVGLWYEMFPVEARRYEVVYDNMPVAGLAAASCHVPAVGRLETARRRLGGKGTPAVPSPPNPLAGMSKGVCGRDQGL